MFTLSGSSQDFGRADVVDIARCIQRRMVFFNRHQSVSFLDDYRFIYRTQVGECFDLAAIDITAGNDETETRNKK